ncbi:MAG: YtxH domain-containing protein [Bacteroidales bacterium]|nr:YtxH domain-containing protein [Bacteroidales bacterium]
MKTAHTVMALVGFAALGAALGILLAPRRGKETRENIKDFLKSHYPAMRTRRLEALADEIADEAKAEVAHVAAKKL